MTNIKRDAVAEAIGTFHLALIGIYGCVNPELVMTRRVSHRLMCMARVKSAVQKQKRIDDAIQNARTVLQSTEQNRADAVRQLSRYSHSGQKWIQLLVETPPDKA
jgi:hypothetical protein